MSNESEFGITVYGATGYTGKLVCEHLHRQYGANGDMDPGYGSTSKMISESAVCLRLNSGVASGGIWTLASALGTTLITRLQDNAGLSFRLEA